MELIRCVERTSGGIQQQKRGWEGGEYVAEYDTPTHPTKLIWMRMGEGRGIALPETTVANNDDGYD